MSRARSLVLLLAVALAAAGCQSTQDKARKLAQSGQKAFTAKGLRITKTNPDVEVTDTTVLHDANGTAAVVELRNRSKREQAGLPIAIDVRGARNRSVFRNDAAGLEPSLVGAPVLEPGQRLAWVNDQVVASTRPKTVRARVGVAQGKPPAQLPKLVLTRPRFQHDPVSGLEVTGKVFNRSKVLQRKLVIYAIARKGGRVVAAGRGGIPKLKPGRRATYNVFFIGDPKGARVTLAAPPTVLQ